MKRRHFLHTATAASLPLFSNGQSGNPLIRSIEKVTLRKNRDGSEGTTWFHPRACMIPQPDGQKPPTALMCLQSIGGSDYFGPVHWSTSSDLGKTWSDPE
ncbi:MAG: exo-alpha-sialidase, partial [Verrucomicrobiales bacterium]|nr:exo-alpha-sialidase [Verrucomicrobiales bacterium]